MSNPLRAADQVGKLTIESAVRSFLDRAERVACAAAKLVVQKAEHVLRAVTVIPKGQEATLLQGNPSQEIVRYAKERNSDLIIMGTHGRKGINHMLMGSVAERVVRTAPCPMLTMRSKAQGTSFDMQL